jgi:hypothetical protein
VVREERVWSDVSWWRVGREGGSWWGRVRSVRV